MMRIPAVWTNNLVSFLFGMGMYAVLVFIPEFVQTPSSAGYGFSASIIQSGLFLLPLTVAMFIFGLLAGPMARAIGSKVSVVAGSTITSVAFVLLTVAHHHDGRSTGPAPSWVPASVWPSRPCPISSSRLSDRSRPGSPRA